MQHAHCTIFHATCQALPIYLITAEVAQIRNTHHRSTKQADVVWAGRTPGYSPREMSVAPSDVLPASLKPLRTSRREGSGRAQLSVVEHALCPLDPAASLRDHLVHESAYGYTDRHRHLKIANVRVVCASGMSVADEFVLWGLLALTFNQPSPSTEFHATPHYCMRKLGLIELCSSTGGQGYRLFRDTIKRLAHVMYENSAFYDPIRGEHREVGFGFLKYSLPIDPASSRAWRFVWDQQFFELCRATGGGLWFDLETYRRLDYASRRLFVFLQKLFHRSTATPALDVRKVCVDTLGFSPTIEVRNLKLKLARCITRLSEEGIVQLPEGTHPKDLFRKHGVGRYSIKLLRGPYFDGQRANKAPVTAEESPLVDPLREIGFDDASIRRILGDYATILVREWSDITLAARERNGEGFFTKSAAAYFMDNIQHAAYGRRSPPDWWRELRQEEARRQRDADRQQYETVGLASEEAAFRQYIEGEAREAFEGVMQQIIANLTSRGKSVEEATEPAHYMARVHFLNRFRRERGASS